MNMEIFRLTPEHAVVREVIDLRNLRPEGEVLPPSTVLWRQSTGAHFVSTVFLHWGEHLGGQFETAIFDDRDGVDILPRCETYAEALALHARVVERLEREQRGAAS